MILRQPRLEQIPQRVVLVPNQKVKPQNAARRRQNSHIIVHRRRPRVQIDVLAHHGLAHVARSQNNVGNVQGPDGLHRHVVTKWLPLFVLEKDPGHLHGHEFTAQRGQLGVVVLQGPSVHLLGVREPLGKVGVDRLGVLVPRIHIGALRGGLEAGILSARADRGFGDQFNGAGPRGERRNEARALCKGMRPEEEGRLEDTVLLALPLALGHHKVRARHVPNPVLVCRRLERKCVLVEVRLGLERVLDVNRQQTNTVGEHFVRHGRRIGHHLDVRGGAGIRHVGPKSHRLDTRHDEATQSVDVGHVDWLKTERTRPIIVRVLEILKFHLVFTLLCRWVLGSIFLPFQRVRYESPTPTRLFLCQPV